MSKILQTTRSNKCQVGSIFRTNSCGNLVILQYENAKSVRVKFLATGFETVATVSNITGGKVKDLFSKTVYGEGIIGEKVFKVDGKYPKTFWLWRNMLKRCYDQTTQKANKCYEGCTVSDSFKYYPYFKEWCEKQIGFNNEDWQLDKDILGESSKTYSEDVCAFVPREINCLNSWNKNNTQDDILGVSHAGYLNKYKTSVRVNNSSKHIGVFDTILEAFQAYKEAKEQHIKDVANKWKDQIDPRVYDAMVNFEFKWEDKETKV